MQINQQPLDRKQIAMIDYFITEDLTQVIANHREELEEVKSLIKAMNHDGIGFRNMAIGALHSFANGAGRDTLSLLKDLTIAHTAASLAVAQGCSLEGFPDLRTAGIQ